MLLTIAMLLAASPAMAQEWGLPRWLVGNWCSEPVDDAMEQALRGEDCTNWVAKRGMLSAVVQRLSGPPDIFTELRVDIAAGRLRYTAEHRHYRRPAWRERYLEVSRGPSEMLFARETEGGRETIRFVREGDWLTVETVAPGNAMSRERYVRR